MSILKKLLFWLLALALAYLLSIGPYIYLVGKDMLPDWAKNAGNSFYRPERRLEQMDWAFKPLDSYKRWWWRMSQTQKPSSEK